MTETELLLLWGKTHGSDADAYHPLLFHLLDVGHVALLLWDDVLPEPVKRQMCAALGCEEPGARLALAFLSGAHDVGKANPAFQFQATPLVWLVEHLKSLGFKLPLRARQEPHNFVSTKELQAFFGNRENFWHADRESRRVLSHISGAHHGTFPNSSNYSAYVEAVMGDKTWQAARLQLLHALKAALCPPDFMFAETMWNPAEVGAIPIVAGLISVADWIGSSQRFEPAGQRSDTPTLAQYLPLSQERARAALQEFGWIKTPAPSAARPDFHDFWKFPPNALQRAVMAQTGAIGAPFLMIAEAPMGVGKTEAALWAADAALAACNSGFYVALPTQATSNAMHARVKAFLDKRFPDENAIHLQLVHGNAALSDDVQIVFNGLNPAFDSDENAATARVVAASWFCGAKRPLLAPFGVGTIDQSLMGALQTRHWFVRLFGLAGKVVIFDEVHAYDTYMSRLLTTLLEWLRELGCSVILLSATLPKAKRRELLQAWQAELPAAEVAYPRLTWCAGDARSARSIAVSPENLAQKVVRIERLPHENLAATLREKLSSGGCAALICNTVAGAQTLFESLKSELGDFVFPDNWILFHARMPFGWRQRIEGQILEKFGKNKAHRPHRAIVVATQVIEQSLDLDFDWMSSEMAPSDLLLQRLGRLHRHAKDEHRADIVRPHKLETPQFAILSASEATGEPPSFGDSEWIYEPEILLRSWLLWRGKTELHLPDEIEELVEATYAPTMDAPDEKWRLALDDAARKAERERQKARDTASNVVVAARNSNGNLRDPEEVVEAPSLDLRDDDDPTTHESVRAATRDGDPSVSVVCLCRLNTRLYLPDQNGAPDLNLEINLSAEPTREHTRALMNASLPLSNRAIYKALAAQNVPPGWKRSPLLRHSRALIFDNGESELAGRRLILDGQLGLRIEKSAPQEKENAE